MALAAERASTVTSPSVLPSHAALAGPQTAPSIRSQTGDCAKAGPDITTNTPSNP